MKIALNLCHKSSYPASMRKRKASEMNEPIQTQTKITERGYSLPELLIVVIIIGILSLFSILYVTASKRLYKVEDQALQVVDILQEAKQRALNERQTMRIEINTVANAVILIDENSASAGDSDDREIKRLRIGTSGEVRVGPRPANVNTNPTEPTPVEPLAFAPSSHPLTTGNSVGVIRFTSSGVVLSAGSNSIGAGATMTGATVYVWKPRAASPTNSEMTRGITVLGPSGTIRTWTYDHATTNPSWRTR